MSASRIASTPSELIRFFLCTQRSDLASQRWAEEWNPFRILGEQRAFGGSVMEQAQGRAGCPQRAGVRCSPVQALSSLVAWRGEDTAPSASNIATPLNARIVGGKILFTLLILSVLRRETLFRL